MKKLTELQNALNNGKEWFYYDLQTADRIYITDEEYTKRQKNSYNEFINDPLNAGDDTSFESWCNEDDFYNHVETKLCELEELLND